MSVCGNHLVEIFQIFILMTCFSSMFSWNFLSESKICFVTWKFDSGNILVSQSKIEEENESKFALTALPLSMQNLNFRETPIVHRKKKTRKENTQLKVTVHEFSSPDRLLYCPVKERICFIVFTINVFGGWLRATFSLQLLVRLRATISSVVKTTFFSSFHLFFWLLKNYHWTVKKNYYL